MKRLINFLLALVLVLAMSPAVRADVIYIPDDGFLKSHEVHCTRVDRGYIARTEVKVYESPESSRVEGTLPEGELVHVYYAWTDGVGNQWGYIEDYENNVYGWIPMAYMQLRYDHISFEEDYGDQFRHTEDWVQLDAALAGQEVAFWSYPGSESCSVWQFDSNTENLPYYGTLYTDGDGREWCYVNYHMGYRDFWICLTDPTADFSTLYPNGAPQVGAPEELPPLPEAEIKPGFTPVRVIIGGGVVLCVICTAVVLLKKKKG